MVRARGSGPFRHPATSDRCGCCVRRRSLVGRARGSSPFGSRALGSSRLRDPTALRDPVRHRARSTFAGHRFAQGWVAADRWVDAAMGHGADRSAVVAPRSRSRTRCCLSSNRRSPFRVAGPAIVVVAVARLARQIVATYARQIAARGGAPRARIEPRHELHHVVEVAQKEELGASCAAIPAENR